MSDHAENDSHAENTQSCHVHVVPVKVLVGVFLALVALTVLTVEAAKFDVGSADVIVSMGIATLKASLVVFIFMHLWYDKPLNKIVFFCSIVFAGFFLCMILLDSHAYDNYVSGFSQDKPPVGLTVETPVPAAPAVPAPVDAEKPEAKPDAKTDAKPTPDK